MKAAVAEPELHWLREFLGRANVEFLYRPAALWCHTRDISSLAALSSTDWAEQPFVCTLLSVTKERLLEQMASCLLEQMAASRAPARAVQAGATTVTSEPDSPHDQQAVELSTITLGGRELAADMMAPGDSIDDGHRFSRLSMGSEAGAAVIPIHSRAPAVSLPPDKGASSQQTVPVVLDTLDTTGDGLVDAVALDLNGDGNIDAVRSLEIRPSPRQRVDAKRLGFGEQQQWLSKAMSSGDAGVDTSGAARRV